MGGGRGYVTYALSSSVTTFLHQRKQSDMHLSQVSRGMTLSSVLCLHPFVSAEESWALVSRLILLSLEGSGPQGPAAEAGRLDRRVPPASLQPSICAASREAEGRSVPFGWHREQENEVITGCCSSSIGSWCSGGSLGRHPFLALVDGNQSTPLQRL